mmetsp:Transcript_34254/g.102601  ORF Transcript_34254/g.102601 Transcript_34254/m.102601 type:complete len:276 (+) Transcript_34254:311-1138(+)
MPRMADERRDQIRLRRRERRISPLLHPRSIRGSRGELSLVQHGSIHRTFRRQGQTIREMHRRHHQLRPGDRHRRGSHHRHRLGVERRRGGVRRVSHDLFLHVRGVQPGTIGDVERSRPLVQRPVEIRGHLPEGPLDGRIQEGRTDQHRSSHGRRRFFRPGRADRSAGAGRIGPPAHVGRSGDARATVQRHRSERRRGRGRFRILPLSPDGIGIQRRVDTRVDVFDVGNDRSDPGHTGGTVLRRGDVRAEDRTRIRIRHERVEGAVGGQRRRVHHQ